ncbi:glycosyltransferase [Vibrio kanaloae]|uniref:glycosyltransferase n=1 Tax=Vibrio kanaloae TaxID=170673 RepID=UPI001E47C7B2|nr:glycosyltransferase [Vibrio kanaloae]
MSANIKKVAVIMSVYRSDNPIDLRLAIDSIINQSYTNLTLFIYRDGSVPVAIDDILAEYYLDRRIVLVKNDVNHGLAKALNALIDKVISFGEYNYIARMDSDDISRPSRIDKQVNFLELNHEIDVCGTSCREFGASYALEEKHLPRSHEELLNFSISRCPLIHPSVMFRATVFKSGIRYPINTVFTEDMALWFELLNKGFKFSNLNDILLDYKLNENTIERRKGFGKAISEIRIRTANMFLLKQFSFKNVVLIYSRLAFHLMPSFLVKLAYKKAR